MDSEYVPANLGCAKCGDCCENIWMYPEFDANRITDNEADKITLEFIRKHWTKTGTDASGWQSWSCAFFDALHRLCTAHNNRPPVCQNYPWYGNPPEPGKIVNTRCSYALDLPPDQRPEGSRPLIPIEVIT